MRRKIIFSLAVVAALAAVLGGLAVVKKMQFDAMAQSQPPPSPTVASTRVEQQTWRQTFSAVGTARPVRGVTVRAEAAGTVTQIGFENGARVEKGDLLVQLDVETERARLRSAQADAELAAIEYRRSKQLRKSGATTQSQLDRDTAALRSAEARVEEIRATIADKTIRAPFAGETGIRQFNLGDYVGPADPLVSLQAFDRVYVNFSLPQKALNSLETGYTVEARTDARPGRVFEGKLTTINPEVDPSTRTIALQATFDNEDRALRSGLFVEVDVVLPQENEVMAVPATAILYAPYGNSVFRIEEKTNGQTGETQLVGRQQFVRLGERRGDYVSIVEGVSPGDRVVSAGAFKLRNGQPLKVNNENAPKPELNPDPPNS